MVLWAMEWACLVVLKACLWFVELCAPGLLNKHAWTTPRSYSKVVDGLLESTGFSNTEEEPKVGCGRWAGWEQGTWTPGAVYLLLAAISTYATSLDHSLNKWGDKLKHPAGKEQSQDWKIHDLLLYPMASHSSDFWHFWSNLLNLGVWRRKGKGKEFNSQVVLIGSSRPCRLLAGHEPHQVLRLLSEWELCCFFPSKFLIQS